MIIPSLKKTVIGLSLVTAFHGVSAEQSPLNLQVPSPLWQDQIIYFLMIDRFNNGDSSNDDQGRGEYDPSRESHYSGGDIVGITQKLDYIQALGATSVWLTPPVANQWWSSESEYSGYHGYWARHFKRVDEHYGDLEDYKQLSSQLHDRGMYLIQDIVLNHTGIFFGYEGQYDPNNTDKNFVLYESDFQSAPEMPPFYMVDRHNPKHAEAHIYNWTPGASSYSNKEQQFTYQLGNLTDINTKNPDVLRAFKDAYQYWIKEVGVDAYRIDTVKYVEHEFWQRFLHDEDGIYPQAKRMGKEHFLTFGEVFEASAPFSNDGEKVVTSFLGTPEKPELNSVIGFPMYFEINRVLAEGQATEQLAYRLTQFMEQYPNPFVIPNFVDNHDTKRFISAASQQALQQALALIFTIPGIPVIYQGTEQALGETRQAMFAGGFASEKSQFDKHSDMYQFVQRLAAIRTENKVFTRGDLKVLGSNKSGPGLLAYSRHYQDDHALILINSAEHDILVNRLNTGLPAGTGFTAIMQSHDSDLPTVSADGGITFVLPARSILVLSPEIPEDTSAIASHAAEVFIKWDANLTGKTLKQDVLLTGIASESHMPLELVINGNVEGAVPFVSDKQGKWQVVLPIRDYGETHYRVEIYAPDHHVASTPQELIGSVSNATLSATVVDPIDDARGLSGKLSAPKQKASQGQMEIKQVSALSAGSNLQITLKMANLTDDWAPANGFDNVSLSIFFDFPEQAGVSVLPLLNGQMIGHRDWDLAHVAYGWGNYMYRAAGASQHETGDKLGIAPKITVNKANNTITLFYQGRDLGITDWQGVAAYITTWDIAGEGYYREIAPEGGEWLFGGGKNTEAKILDDILLVLQEVK